MYRKTITLLFLTSGVLESPPILAMSVALGRYRTWSVTWFVSYSTQESPQRSALGMAFYPWTQSGLIVVLSHDWGTQICYEAARMRPDLFRAVVGAVIPVRRAVTFATVFRS